MSNSSSATRQTMQKLGLANTFRLIVAVAMFVTSFATASMIVLGVDPELAALSVPAVATLPLIWGAGNE